MTKLRLIFPFLHSCLFLFFYMADDSLQSPIQSLLLGDTSIAKEKIGLKTAASAWEYGVLTPSHPEFPSFFNKPLELI